MCLARPNRFLAPPALVALLAACAGSTVAPPSNQVVSPAHETAATANAAAVYQPLAVGDYWRYTCNHSFTIEDRVVGTHRVRGRLVYALSLQIPASPKKSATVLQLLANDAKGNTSIYGYVIHRTVHAVRATEIVAKHPVLNEHYDYPAPRHGKISRVFVGFENTNPTKLGTFRVAPYFESNATHNYGYSLGRGVMEQDHGPHFKFDCLIVKYVLH